MVGDTNFGTSSELRELMSKVHCYIQTILITWSHCYKVYDVGCTSYKS